jgi:hypothetical protein
MRAIAGVIAGKRVPPPALWAVWLVTRAVLYLATTAPNMNGDVGIYQRWYECCLAHGSFPAADPMWQYPPGAAVILWLPGVLKISYTDSFVLLIIACDLAVSVMLYVAGRRGGSLAGAWYWVCGVPLLGAVAVTRFDLFPVGLSVAALCLARGGSLRGGLIGIGTVVKVWPVTLLVGLAPGQGRRGLAAAIVAPAATCLLFAHATASFLTHQIARGAEIESVAATPMMLWRLAGWPGRLVFRFGSYQLSGPYAGAVMDACRLSLVVGAAAVLGWRLLVALGRVRWRPEFAADAPLAATLLFLVVSPVLSPQYLLWVMGVAAACLAIGRTTQRSAAVAVLAAAGLTQVVFPIGWPSLLSGSIAVTAVLAVRNGLLVVAAVLSCKRILRATAVSDDDGLPEPTAALVGDTHSTPGRSPTQAGNQKSTARESRLHHSDWCD